MELDDIMAAEHHQQELEFQEWLLSKKQAENKDAYKSMGYQLSFDFQ